MQQPALPLYGQVVRIQRKLYLLGKARQGMLSQREVRDERRGHCPSVRVPIVGPVRRQQRTERVGAVVLPSAEVRQVFPPNSQTRLPREGGDPFRRVATAVDTCVSVDLACGEVWKPDC